MHGRVAVVGHLVHVVVCLCLEPLEPLQVPARQEARGVEAGPEGPLYPDGVGRQQDCIERDEPDPDPPLVRQHNVVGHRVEQRQRDVGVEGDIRLDGDIAVDDATSVGLDRATHGPLALDGRRGGRGGRAGGPVAHGVDVPVGRIASLRHLRHRLGARLARADEHGRRTPLHLSWITDCNGLLDVTRATKNSRGGVHNKAACKTGNTRYMYRIPVYR